MPRNDAAERYSPLIADAFRPGRTEREATKKSDVVRLNLSPHVPIARVAMVTSSTATSAEAPSFMMSSAAAGRS